MDYDIWPAWYKFPKDHKCPACNRQKKEWVRQDKNGKMMCHIDDAGICKDCNDVMRNPSKFLNVHDCYEIKKYCVVENNKPHKVRKQYAEKMPSWQEVE